MVVVDIIILVLALGIIISIHEFGHFFVAKLANVLCSEFAIGMGPILYSKKKKGWETKFSIRAIPFGGFAAMAGEDEASSYLRKNDKIGLILDEKKWVKNIVLDQSKFKDCDIVGNVKYYNTYNDDKKLYVTIRTEEGLLKYYLLLKFEYIFPKNKKEQNAPKSRSFEAKEKFPRFLILFAGPMMNFLLGLFLLFLVFLINGKPVNSNKLGFVEKFQRSNLLENKIKKGDILLKIDGVDIQNQGFAGLEEYLSNNIKQSYKLLFKDKGEVIVYPRIIIPSLGLTNEGYEKENEIVVGKLYKGVKKEIKPGNKITAINEKPVSSWNELVAEIKTLLDTEQYTEVVLKYTNDKNEEKISKKLKLISKRVLKEQGVDIAQVTLGISSKTKFDIFYAAEAGVKSMWKITRRTFDTLKSLFDTTSGIGVTDLSGPVGIFQLIKRARERSFTDLLFLIAFLSINIGFLNLLPIPALDGGRILFLTIEAISGRKISKTLEQKVNFIMFILLLALMVFVIGIDIVKLF